MSRARQQSGFTLIELLVVVAIIALLLAMLLPSMQRARTAARITKAHAELRSIAVALELYMDNNDGQLPPTRFSCSMRSAYELPGELGRNHYLPHSRKLVTSSVGDAFIDAVAMRDVFLPSETYKYRAVGTAILNETTLLEPPHGASLWVPDAFPHCSEPEGRYYLDPDESPVRYALWSIGPDVDSPKFKETPGHMPIPDRYWCKGSGDTGVITHFQGSDGRFYMSR